MSIKLSKEGMDDSAHRFLVLRRKLENALTPGGVFDDVVTIRLTKWDTAFLIEAIDELLLVKEEQ